MSSSTAIVSVVHDPPRILKGNSRVRPDVAGWVSVVHDPPRILKVVCMIRRRRRVFRLSRSRSAEDTERGRARVLDAVAETVSVVHDPPRILKGGVEVWVTDAYGLSQSFTIRRGY